MIRAALLIARKDSRLSFSSAGALPQAMLLGLLLIFVFSLSKDVGEKVSPREAAAIFWLGSVFCQILIFNSLYALEETNSARECLLLSDAPPQAIWLGKALAGLGLLCLAQMVYIPAAIVFLGQAFWGPLAPGLAALALGNAGLCALGSFLGALGQGSGGRESLLTIILFPLLIPLLLCAISLGARTLGAPEASESSWIGLGCAFDAIFTGASLCLFGHLYGVGE